MESDNEIITRIKGGDVQSYELLVRKYQCPVKRLVSRYESNAQDVEDIAQDTFINAYRGLANFRSDSSFFSWLYRIAVNSTMRHLKRRNRNVCINLASIDEFRSFYADDYYEKITPEYQALSEEIGVEIHKVLSDMPVEFRTALLMSVYDGLSYQSISEVTQVPVGTVRSRIHRGREIIIKNMSCLTV